MNHNMRGVQTRLHALPRPNELSLFFPFPVFDFWLKDGAGNVGLPVPRAFFVSFSATAALACDCCIALNSLTTFMILFE